MSFQQNTGKTIQQAFLQFHEKNPKVYELFKKEVKRALDVGHKKMSVKTLLNYIKWEMFVRTYDETEYTDPKTGLKVRFKINDAYTSRYARLYLQEHPEHEGIFELREIRSN